MSRYPPPPSPLPNPGLSTVSERAFFSPAADRSAFGTAQGLSGKCQTCTCITPQNCEASLTNDRFVFAPGFDPRQVHTHILSTSLIFGLAILFSFNVSPPQLGREVSARHGRLNLLKLVISAQGSLPGCEETSSSSSGIACSRL